MRALRKAADDGLPLDAPDWELHLIAVVPGTLCADGRFDKEVFLAADARDGVDDLLALGLELCHVVEVLKLAAAALLVDRAGWHDTVTACAQDLDEVGLGIRLLDLINSGLHRFSRQGSRHKDRKVFVSPYPFAARAERADRNLI